MPFAIRKVPKKELYWVVNKETGKKHSKEGLPKETAEAQRKALYAAESGYVMRGKGIEMNLMQQMAQSAYRGKTKLQIGPFKLLTSTPTLKFYKDDKQIIIAVRGTDLGDKNDLAADALAIVGNLRNSERWKQDEAKIKDVQTQFPKDEYRYIAVGHSLGGAIIDLMLRDKLIRSALSYNPLVEPQELGGNSLHRRIYHKDDPLYQIFGRFIPNVEVRRTAEPFWKYYLRHNLPFGLGELFTLYDRHRVGAFRGGSKMKGGMTFNDFRRWWHTPLYEEDRNQLALAGQYDEYARTRGDVALTLLTSIAGIGGTASAQTYDSESGTYIMPVLASLVASPAAGALLSTLIRLLPMPPSAEQDRLAEEARQARAARVITDRQMEAERTRDTAIIVNPMTEFQRTAARIEDEQRRSARISAARPHIRVGSILPQANIGDVEIEMTPQRLAEAQAQQEAELNAEVFENPLRRGQRVEFAPQMIQDVGDDRDADQKQDERDYVEGGARELVFEDQLQELDYPPKKYLAKVKAKAKKAGYDPKKLSFCRDGVHKLQYETPDEKMVKFGRVGYGDFLIWSFLERNGKVEKGEAKKRKKAYLKRASAIKGDWEEDKHSPNNLAMKILWM